MLMGILRLVAFTSPKLMGIPKSVAGGSSKLMGILRLVAFTSFIQVDILKSAAEEGRMSMR